MAYHSDNEPGGTFRESARLLLRGLIPFTLPLLALAWLAGHLAAGVFIMLDGRTPAIQLGVTLWLSGALVAATLGFGALVGARLCGLPAPHSATAAARVGRVWLWLTFWMALPAAALAGLSIFVSAPLEAWLHPYLQERAAGFWRTLPVRELSGGLILYGVVVAAWGLWLWLPATTLGLRETPVGSDLSTAHRALQRIGTLEAWMLGLAAVTIPASVLVQPLAFLGLVLPVLWAALMVSGVRRFGDPYRRAGGPSAAAAPER